MSTGVSGISILVDRFLDDLRDRLDAGSQGIAIQSEIGELRALWPEHAGDSVSVEPVRLPVCDYLAPALDQARAGCESRLALSIAALAPALRWTYSYPTNPRDRDLSSKVGFAQIAGQRGLQNDARIHIGLTLIAPHVVYPAHRHPAVELYLVVSGIALWQSGNAEPALLPPGSIILHPSEVVHAMTTFDQPLLAIWTWRGNLASPSVYVNLRAEAPPA